MKGLPESLHSSPLEIKRGVRRTFEDISEHFSRTRLAPWTEVRGYVDRLGGGETAVDLGCGNARHAALLTRKYGRVLALDFARNLLLESANVGGDHARLKLVQADITALPIRSRSADTILHVAALHHLPTKEERIKSLKEVKRILKPGGEALISVWSVTDRRFQDPGAMRTLIGNDYDIMIPWKSNIGNNELKGERYYHIFTEEDFREHLGEAGIPADKVYSGHDNWY